MKIQDLFESDEDKIFAWLHDTKNISIQGSTRVLDLAKMFNSDTVKIDGGGVTIAIPDTSFQAFSIEFHQSPPFKIKQLTIDRLKIKSGIQCPEKLNGMLTIVGDGTFDKCPKIVTDALKCEDFKSLKDIHKHVDKVGTILIGELRGAILGVILMDAAQILCLSYVSGKPKKAAAIVGKYLGQGQKGVVKAQRELLENDLDDFAEL